MDNAKDRTCLRCRDHETILQLRGHYRIGFGMRVTDSYEVEQDKFNYAEVWLRDMPTGEDRSGTE